MQSREEEGALAPTNSPVTFSRENSICHPQDIVTALKEANLLAAESENTDSLSTLHRGMRIEPGKVVFVLCGDSDTVKRHAREVIYTHEITDMYVVEDANTRQSVTDDSWIEYGFYLNATPENHEQLTKMFWYLGKIFDQFEDPADIGNMYGDKPGHVLKHAAQSAKDFYARPLEMTLTSIKNLLESGVELQHWTEQEKKIVKVISQQEAKHATWQGSLFKFLFSEPRLESEEQLRNNLSELNARINKPK